MSLKQGGKADIADVARRAGVSISTVSRSFNHPNLVNLATRKKIEKSVKALGYIRNRAAQAMHGRRSGTIDRMRERSHTALPKGFPVTPSQRSKMDHGMVPRRKMRTSLWAFAC